MKEESLRAEDWKGKGGIFSSAHFRPITTASGTFLNMAKSAASCFFWHRRERPGTTLRTLCVVAFDFMARAGGQRLGREERRTLSCLLDLGALINDHFDQHQFSKCTYRKLRKRLAVNESVRAIYRAYFSELRRAERNRPRLRLSCRKGILKETADYRETVVRISLAALAAIAFGQPNGGNVDGARNSPAKETCSPHLFALAMLIQICDDLLDWRRDWRAGLPTFATAELLRCAGQADDGGADFRRVHANVERAAATYLAAPPRQECTFWPFVPCAYAAFLLVKLLSSLVLRGCVKQEATGKTGLGVIDLSPRF